MIDLIVVDRAGTEHVLEAKPGLSVMETVRDHGLDELLALCGGCCSCATCHVYVGEECARAFPEVSDDENDLLDSSDHRTAASRLACQLMIAEDAASMRIIIAPED